MEAWLKGRSKILKIIRLRRNGVGVGGTQVTSKLQTLTLPIFVKKKKIKPCSSLLFIPLPPAKRVKNSDSQGS